MENWSHFPTQQGNFEIIQTRMERFPAPREADGNVVCTYSGDDLKTGHIWSGNLANTIWERDLPYARPEATTNSLGVSLDSRRVQPVGALSFVTVDIQPPAKQETVMKRRKDVPRALPHHVEHTITQQPYPASPRTFTPLGGCKRAVPRAV